MDCRLSLPASSLSPTFLIIIIMTAMKKHSTHTHTHYLSRFNKTVVRFVLPVDRSHLVICRRDYNIILGGGYRSLFLCNANVRTIRRFPVPYWPTCTEGQDKMKNFIRGGAEIEFCSQFRNSRVTGHCDCRTVQSFSVHCSDFRRSSGVSHPFAGAKIFRNRLRMRKQGHGRILFPSPRTTSLLSLISHPTDNEISIIRCSLRQF